MPRQKNTINYKNIYQCINNNEKPLKIPRACETRWLSVEAAVSRILNQWEELKVHFGIAFATEKCRNAKVLYDYYCDDINKLYMVFLKPVFGDMQRLNKGFQAKNANATQLLSDILTAIDSLKMKIIPPSIKVNILEDDFEVYVERNLYLGYAFAEEFAIRNVCTNFTIELIKQLKKRLPDNVSILRKVVHLSVENVLRANKADIMPVVKYFQCKNIENIMQQYEKIHLIQWHNTTETVKFWAEALKYTDAGGVQIFRDLAEFALEIMSLPWSNAEVERIFSQMNLIKSNLRNRMKIKTLDAILNIRYGLRRNEKCCHDYILPTKYINMIHGNEKYGSQIDIDVDHIVSLLNTM